MVIYKAKRMIHNRPITCLEPYTFIFSTGRNLNLEQHSSWGALNSRISTTLIDLINQIVNRLHHSNNSIITSPFVFFINRTLYQFFASLKIVIEWKYWNVWDKLIINKLIDHWSTKTGRLIPKHGLRLIYYLELAKVPSLAWGYKKKCF